MSGQLSKTVKQKNGVNISLIGGNTYVKCIGNYRSIDRMAVNKKGCGLRKV